MTRIIGKVISGGQTGVDQAALRAARRCKIETGGTMPLGFLTEDGSGPRVAARFGLVEHVSAKYPPRTATNVHDADCTLIIGPEHVDDEPGCLLTLRMCESMKKPFHVHKIDDLGAAGFHARLWLRSVWRSHALVPLVLNVAGSRESLHPGIGERAEHWLVRFFSNIGEPVR